MIVIRAVRGPGEATMVPQPALAPLRRWDPERIGPFALLGPARRRRDGPGLPRPVTGRPAGRGQDDQRSSYAEEPDFRDRFAHEVAAARRVSGVFTAAVVAADPDAEVPWLATAYVPAPSLTRLVATVRPAAGAGGALAGRRLRRGAGVHPRRRAGAPRPQAVERAGLAGRTAGDRLRGGPGGRADPAHRDPGALGTPAYMAPEQARDTRRRPGQRRVLARLDAAVRGDRARAVPGRDDRWTCWSGWPPSRRT